MTRKEITLRAQVQKMVHFIGVWMPYYLAINTIPVDPQTAQLYRTSPRFL